MTLNGLWTIGTYGVWIHMNRKSELCQKGRRLGKYRAAVDLVESIARIWATIYVHIPRKN